MRSLAPARPATRRAAALLVLCATVLAGCSSVSLDEPIESRTWRLANLGMQPVVPSADPQRDPQLVFDRSSGRVSGSGGCNRITGSYQRDGTKLKIGPLAATRMACLDAGRGALESGFLAALQSTASYTMNGQDLVLFDARGQAVATLSSASTR